MSTELVPSTIAISQWRLEARGVSCPRIGDESFGFSVLVDQLSRESEHVVQHRLSIGKTRSPFVITPHYEG